MSKRLHQFTLTTQHGQVFVRCRCGWGVPFKHGTRRAIATAKRRYAFHLEPRPPIYLRVTNIALDKQ